MASEEPTGPECMQTPAGKRSWEEWAPGPPQTPEQMAWKLGLYERLGKPRFVCAPMVNQSELPFRMLCRRYGTELCYTPMIHSKIILEHPRYRDRAEFQFAEEDRPTIAQYCANDPEILLRASRFVEGRAAALDLNFGCPQMIAKRGNYGAFLLDQVPLMCSLVNVIHTRSPLPVTAKIRIVDKGPKTIEMCLALQAAGAAILTVHGRTKEEKKQLIRDCDWDTIRAIKKAMSIPVFCNGGAENYEDVLECLEYTGCDGYMAAEPLLSNPAMFTPSPKCPSAITMAREYIELVGKYCGLEKAPLKIVRPHLFKILFRELQICETLRMELSCCKPPFLTEVLPKMEARIEEIGEDRFKEIYAYTNSWYRRYNKTREPEEHAQLLGDATRKLFGKKDIVVNVDTAGEDGYKDAMKSIFAKTDSDSDSDDGGGCPGVDEEPWAAAEQRDS